MIVGGGRQAPEIEVDHAWREADQGRWEGLTYAEVLERYPDEARTRFADIWNIAPEHGEALSSACDRILAAWHALLARHDGGRILLVTQAAPIQFVVCKLLGIPPMRYWQLRTDLGSLTAVDLYPSAAIVRTLNETPPLAPEQ